MQREKLFPTAHPMGQRLSEWEQRRRWALPLFQTRTCAGCGEATTFQLEDAVGDWYVCLNCGRYA
jgi:hypothetical protein